MSIELYQFGDSPCCMKVRIALAEKNLPWEERFLRSWEFDHFQPDYLRLNPHGIVPTLVHDGRVVIQSNAIIEFLDDQFPGPVPLKPEDPHMAAIMRQWMFEEQDHLFKLIITLSFNTMMKLREKAFGMARMVEWSKRHPDQDRAQDYLRRVTEPADQDAVAAAERKFRWHMERLEQQLDTSGGPWICGETFSLADIAVAPMMDRVEFLDRDHLWRSLPGVTSWFGRIKERPSYEAGVHPFHYRMWGPRKSVEEYPYSEGDYPPSAIASTNR